MWWPRKPGRRACFSPGAGAAAAASLGAASLGAALILHATFVVLGLPLSVVLAVSLCSAVVRAARQTGRKSPSEAICMFIQVRTGRRAVTIREMNTAPTCMRVLSGVRPLSYYPQNPNSRPTQPKLLSLCQQQRHLRRTGTACLDLVPLIRICRLGTVWNGLVAIKR